ncbi:MAG: GGDEF domain-containing protein [Eggerthellaceae bacterium]|nr:GGDEF domain-containing protein [Eggerthellaceae bacterium]
MTNSDLAPEPEIHAPKIKTLNTVSVVIAALLVVVSIVVIGRLVQSSNQSESVHARYDACVSAATELRIASDYLTTQCRMFVMTGDSSYMDAYFEELFVTKRRDAAVDTLGLETGDANAAAELTAALAESNKLAEREMYAMRLTAEAIGTDPLPGQLVAIEVSPEDEALSNADKRSLAQSMVLGDEYREEKGLILQDVGNCAESLVRSLEQKVLDHDRMTDKLLGIQIAITVLLLLIVAFAAVSNHFLVTRPMRLHEESLREERPFAVVGSYEIRRVAVAYNSLLEEARRRGESLKHEAETDPLTGVLNRGPFSQLIEENSPNTALIVADVDYFKQINDRYGHEVGDAILKKVASTIVENFRSTDHVCRIGGDEFAVVATRISSSGRKVIEAKLAAIAAALADTSDGLPEVAMSFGVAFSDLLTGEATLYREADRALYVSKSAGRNAATFCGDEAPAEAQ